MKDRGKAVETFSYFPDFNYSASSSSDFPCKRHPPSSSSSSSSVGICAYCLKDRLLKLVCSDCGEQRLSSCSCSSDISSSRRNSSAVEVGSVGRISFLLENEKPDPPPKPQSEVAPPLLKRSRSSCTGEAKRGGNFWRIGRLFRRKKKKKSEGNVWVFDHAAVSRTRSLCSFRDEGSELGFSSAKVSDFNGGLGFESGKQSNFSEPEPRRSGCARGSLDSDFPIRASEFYAMDDSAFIDLKLDLSSESKTDYSVFPKLSDLSESDFVGNHDDVCSNGGGGGGGSCRITFNDRGGIEKGGKGHRVWKWIFRHNQTGYWRSASKKDGKIIS